MNHFDLSTPAEFGTDEWWEVALGSLRVKAWVLRCFHRRKVLPPDVVLPPDESATRLGFVPTHHWNNGLFSASATSFTMATDALGIMESFGRSYASGA